MRLKALNIQRQTWTPGNPLQGSIEFMDGTGEIKISVDDEQCQRIVAIVADALVAHTRKLAEDMTANILMASIQHPALEAKE